MTNKRDTRDANDILMEEGPDALISMVDSAKPVKVDGQGKSKKAPLDNAPTMASLYGPNQLKTDQERSLVSLAVLPGWNKKGAESPETEPETNGQGHGWGKDLDDALGGGVCPGYFLAVGAAAAGAGKTSWIMQIADGLALRTRQTVESKKGKAPLTPVLIASEMSPQALSWRTLARWTGVDASIFRAGKTEENKEEGAWKRAKEALSSESALGASRKFIRIWQGQGSGDDFLSALEEIVGKWKKDLKEKYECEVWPVVVVDPIQRFANHEKGEVEGDNAMVEGLQDAGQAGEWITIVTSDTNKQSATETDNNETDTGPKNPAQEGAKAFRGTYRLMHLPDAAIYLRPNYSRRDEVWAYIIKNRWGPTAQNKYGDQPGRVTYTWERAKMRFGPPKKDVTEKKTEKNGDSYGETGGIFQ